MKFGKQLIEEIKNSRTEYGEALFWWLGQSGYIVKAGGKTVMIDGFLNDVPSRLQPVMIKPEELSGIDYIFGTHDHDDHIDRESWRKIAPVCPDTKFVVPSRFISDLSADLSIPEDRFIGINEGTSSFEADGIRIEGIASAHEDLDYDEKTGEYPYTGYIIDMNGVRIYHSGDCVVYEGLETKLKNRSPIDIAFVPISGRDGKRLRSNCIGNMTFQEAVCLICHIKPMLAVPGHFDMFPGNTADPMDFADYLEIKDPSVDYWIGARETCVRYRKEN